MKQVNKEHYTFENYCYFDRWVSYWYQIQNILKKKPESILEIGPGDRIVKDVLQSNIKTKYVTVDIADDIFPDFVADIRELPFKDSKFDIVVACEVLEHLPFDDFDLALSEINRVSRKYALISLPHFGPELSMSFKFPFFKKVKIFFKVPFFKKHVFNGQHHWEIGKSGYSISKIKRKIKNYFNIEKSFVPSESPYHHFFILKKKSINEQ